MEHTATVPPLARGVSHEPSIRAELTVTPSHASVRLDGVPLTLPFSGELPRDGRLHSLEASAPLHQTVHQLVGFDRDRTIHLRLSPITEEPKPRRDKERERKRERKRDASAPAAAPELPPEAAEEAATAPLEPPAARADPEPGDDLPARKRRPRAIDTNDPYEVPTR
jgi:hypothetical protein